MAAAATAACSSGRAAAPGPLPLAPVASAGPRRTTASHPGAGHQRGGARGRGQGAPPQLLMGGLVGARGPRAWRHSLVMRPRAPRPGARPVGEGPPGGPAPRRLRAHARARAGRPTGPLPPDEPAHRARTSSTRARIAAPRRFCWRSPREETAPSPPSSPSSPRATRPRRWSTGGSGDVVLSQKLQKRRGGAMSKVEFASAHSAGLEPPRR